MVEAVKMHHTLLIEDRGRVTVNGVRAVNSIFEKEIELVIDGSKVVIRGVKLSASKLVLEEGILIVEGEKILSISYANSGYKKGFSLKKVFK